MPVNNLGADLQRFYDLLDELETGLGGTRLMSECSGKLPWPRRGVYFFFEPGEIRHDDSRPRVVRVGTHALKTGGKSTLWGRLRAHRGSGDGGGNHRGSIFRSHVGSAMISAGMSSIETPQWSIGSSAGKDVRESERPLEIQVSEYIGRMGLLWLTVEDDPGPTSDRAFLEKNAIALISGEGVRTDQPSPTWLGRYSTHPLIRESGLWNVDFIHAHYEESFLDIFERYVRSTITVFGVG